MSPSEHAAGMSKLQIAVIALVAASGALVALYADATVEVIAAGAFGGAIAGVVLWRYLVWAYQEGSSKRPEREETEYEKRERFD